MEPRGTPKAWWEVGNQKHDDSQKKQEHNDQERTKNMKSKHHKLAPSMYLCFYNILTMCARLNACEAHWSIIDIML
jgi:hypothetical protein